MLNGNTPPTARKGNDVLFVSIENASVKSNPTPGGNSGDLLQYPDQYQLTIKMKTNKKASRIHPSETKHRRASTQSDHKSTTNATMKRTLEEDDMELEEDDYDQSNNAWISIKKNKSVVVPMEGQEQSTEVVVLGEDLVFEILRHADARTLARAACVSQQWRRTAEDERLWEGVCTRHWTHMGCGVQQLRSVVLALGGFRRLHSLYLLPLLQHPSNSSSYSSSLLPIMPFSSSPVSPPFPTSSAATSYPGNGGLGKRKARWGKDEVNLSLSLLSIQRYYENMGTNNRGGSGGNSGGGYNSR